MTQNSLNYNRLLEEQRHQQEVERETRTNNELVRDEVLRHNLAMEAQATKDLNERIRAAKASEALKQLDQSVSLQNQQNQLRMAGINASTQRYSSDQNLIGVRFASTRAEQSAARVATINQGSTLANANVNAKSQANVAKINADAAIGRQTLQQTFTANQAAAQRRFEASQQERRLQQSERESNRSFVSNIINAGTKNIGSLLQVGRLILGGL